MNLVSQLRSQARSEGPPDATNLSRGLGWFSLALGLTELALPRMLARAIGIEPGVGTATVLRTMGAREIAAGLAVLFQPQRPLPLWSRVAGDALDIALLSYAATDPCTSRPRIAGAIAAAAGVTALDIVAGRRTQRAYDQANRPVIWSVTINKPPQEVYAFYRRLQQLPMFMDYLESVRETGPKTSHWVARLPIGSVEWDAEIVEDRPGQLIVWQSVAGSPIKTRGRVTFAKTPGRNMTELRVEMQLGFLGTRPSTSLARFFSKAQIKGDLRRFKQIMETGEVLYSDASQHRLPHPARPSERAEGARFQRAAEMPYIPSPPTAEKGITQ